jgi:hypothetical protein
MNVYEQLISEWLSIRGYIVINNAKVGKNVLGGSDHNTSGGGWAGDLHVVGWHPVTGDLVNYEPSIDSNNWSAREERYARKFSVAKKYIREIPQLAAVPERTLENLRCVAVMSHSPKGMPEKMDWIGGELITHDKLIDDIEAWIRGSYGLLALGAIPEAYPLLRTIQLALIGYYRKRTSVAGDTHRIKQPRKVRKTKLRKLKDSIKREHGFDCVMFKAGCFFESIEEDAELMNNLFGHKLHDCGGTRPYTVSGFPTNRVLSIAKELESAKLRFAMLEPLSDEPGAKEITVCSDQALIGTIVTH